MNTIDFTERLLKDEKIVWSGGPAPGLPLTRRDWLLIPFSLLWCSFAIFWEIGVIETQAPVFMRLFGVPFVLVGLYFVAGRFLLDAWIRRRMHYAVTNKRVLIARSRPFSKFTAISLDRLPETSLSESTDGRGTIRFGQTAPFWFSGGGGLFRLDSLARSYATIHGDRECPKRFFIAASRAPIRVTRQCRTMQVEAHAGAAARR